MFLYNILTGGSSKQQLPKYDKISFKISLSDNIPQYLECTSSQSNKVYHYDQQEQLTPSHPLFTKIFKQSNTTKQRKNSSTKSEENKKDANSLRLSNKENVQNDHNNVAVDEDIEHQRSIQFIDGKQVDEFASQDEQQLTHGTQPEQQPHQQYHMYTTTENDTLFGLALKLDIREHDIQQLNGIGESIYPGMTIKLPRHCDVSKLYEIPQQQPMKVKISELLGSEIGGGHAETDKYEVEYYAGLAGYIKGVLTINNNYIIFNPDLEDKGNLENYSIEKLLKFNAILETVDIQNVEFIDIPEMGQEEGDGEGDNPQHNFIVQIFLYIVGNSKIQKKYKDRLTKLKSEKKAIASISFTLRHYKDCAKQKCQQIISKVNSILQHHEQLSTSQKLLKPSEKSQQKHLTNIPFFDIIHENLHPKMKEQIVSSTPDKSMYSFEPLSPVSPSLVCGILTETSDVISDMQFHNLSFSLPLLYQQCNWTRIYSSTVNGTSFQTFLKKSQGQQPLILLVKEYKGWKFGAYLCESLQTGKTGRGEMFLFTFKDDSEVPNTYKWTGKNEFFVYMEKDSGIGIGMGMKYGLFVKNTMDKGSSAATLTFGNGESLSKKEDFIVEEVQLWTIDNGY